MKAYFATFKLLGQSIVGSDFIILVAAMLTLFSLLATLWGKRNIKSRQASWKRKKNSNFTKFLMKSTNKFYTVFTTMITVFPLLGMLGTVFGLMGLDLSDGAQMDNIRTNFFVALTSTAWGIIFAVIFKLLNAFVEDDVEEQIEIAKKLLETDENLE